MAETLDNLGRRVNSANMSIGELKSLVATLMKSKVGPSKPLSSLDSKEQKKVEKPIDLKPLIEAFEKHVKGHKEDIQEQKSLVEEIKSLLSERKKEAPKSRTKDEQPVESKKEGLAEKAINGLKSILKKDKRQGEIVSESTEGLYKVFSKKGSGYTHDIYCEKWLQQIYNTLSKIADKLKVNNVPDASSVAAETQSQDFVEKSKKSIPENASKGGSFAESRRELSRVEDYLDSVGEGFQSRSEDLWDVIDTFSNIKKLFTGKLTKRQEVEWAGSWTTKIDDVVKYYNNKFKVGTDEAASLSEVLKDDRFKAAFNKLNLDQSLLSADEVTQQETINSLIRVQSKELVNQGRIQRRNTTAYKSLRQEVESTLNAIQDTIFGFKVFEKLTDGILKKEVKFTQEIRAAAFETAGITGDLSSIQKSYESIGKTTSKTGVSRDKFQESYIRGLKAGVRDQKKLNTLVTAQLNTEKQIGLEAGSLGDQFIEYSTSLKLNESQISAVGRGIREVGRNSGLVGEKLKEAVTSSKQFVDQMKKAGTVTAASITNITGLQAEFQKLGVDGQKVMTALSSSTGFFEADQQTLTLIAQGAAAVGLVSAAQQGVIMKNKEMMKGLSVGFKDVINKFGLAGESVEELRNSLADLSTYDQMAINMRLKAAFGVESNELLLLIEGLENSSKTLGEKLRDLNKEKQKNLTLQEMEKVLTDERNLKLSATLGVLTGISEAAKGAGSMGEALARFGRRRQEFENDINALGHSWTSEVDVARSSLKTSISTLNEGLKKAGKRELSISTSEIEAALKDQTAFRELVSKVEEGERELATAQKSQVDPLTSMDQKLTEMNDTLRNISQSLISGTFSSMLGKAAIALVGIAALLGSGFITIEKMATGFANVLNILFRKRDPTSDTAQGPFDMIKKLFSKKPAEGAKVPEPTAGSEASAGGSAGKLAEAVSNAVKGKSQDATSTASTSWQDKLLELNGSMLEALNKIASCICDAAKNVSATDKAEKSAGEGVKKDRFTAQEKAERKAKLQEIKNIKADKKLNEMEKKIKVKEILAGKVQTPKESGFDLKSLISSGVEMAKSAAGIMLLAAGAVALAAAIVFLSDKIIGAFNLDLSKIIQVAATVAALAAAGAAIAAAGYGAYILLTGDKESKEFPKISKLLTRNVASQVAALLVLGPALVLLGATIVKMAQMIVGAFGLDITTVAQTAGTVAAVVAAAGTLTLAASEALEGLEKLSDNKFIKMPEDFKKKLWSATKAILTIGPGLVLLGAAIVKFSQVVMGVLNLDAAKIGIVAAQVAALMAGAGAIAGAVAGAMFGLYGLGLLDDIYQANKSTITKGGMALMMLAPLIVFLAAALNRVITGVLGLMGVDAGKAAKAAYDVAALIASSALISFAIIGSLAGLFGLGMLAAAVTGPQALAILGGAAALFLLTPPIIMLASALVNMVKGIMSTREMDASTAAKTAYQVAGIIGAAGAIALSVMAAMAGLAGLGYLGAVVAFSIPAMIGGAIALYALTPVVLSLASSIIQMAGSIAGGLVSQSDTKKVVEGVSSILGAAAQISLSVLASVAGLSILGLFFTAAMLAIPLMWLGTRAFGALINPIVNFIDAVKEASNKIGSSINPSEAKSMSEGVGAVLQSVGDITKNIASTATSMASFPKYGSFWNWLTGSTIADLMNNGVDALLGLAMPIFRYVSAIKFFSKFIGTLINPSEAASMASGVGEILQSCANITESIGKSAESLKKVKSSEGIFDYLRGGVAGMAKRGVSALNALASPIKSYVESIKSFSSQVGSILSPKMAAEMGEGIATIICATGSVAQAILITKDNLSSVQYKEWGWFGTNYVKQMEAGSASLEKLSKPVISYVEVIKRFSKKLGNKLNPRKAASMACGVAAIISSTGEVTKRILETKEELSKIKTTVGWGWFKKDYVKKSNEGVDALKKLSVPIANYVGTISDFSKSVGAKLNVNQAASMARGVADILNATGDVTEKIIATKDKLVSIKSSEGFWLWATDIPKSMQKGVKALEEFKGPLIDYVTSIVSFSLDVGNKVKPSDAKMASKALSQVAEIVATFSCVLDYLQSKINPLTQSGWLKDSPIGEITKAKGEIEKFFPVLVSFIQSIVEKVNGAFTESAPLKLAVKNLGFIAQVFQSVADTTSTVKEKIVPLTTSGWFKGSDIDAVKSSIPLFSGFFEGVSSFINEGLITPISKIKDTSLLKEASKKLPVVAQVLSEATGSINSLQSMIELTSGGFFSKSPLKTINDNKAKFAEYFAGISGFLNSGVIEPIKKITGTNELIEAGAKMRDLGCFLYGFKLTLESLSGVFSLMESDSIWKDSPLKQIQKNKDEFAKYINMSKEFIISGILGPTLELPDGVIEIAAGKLSAAATMISKVPEVIKNLAYSVSLATKTDDFFGDAPMKDIVDSKDKFSVWFKEIAIFIRDGISNPVAKEMKNIDLAGASSTMSAMSNIVSSIMPIMNNLIKVMGLMSGETGDRLDEDFDIDKIILYKDKFANHFEKIAIFLRDGIAEPVKKIFPETKGLRETSQILSSMSSIVSGIPRIILGMAQGFVPLVESKDGLPPMEKIIDTQEQFKEWFLQIADFLRQGIVDPINSKIGDSKEIQKAGRTLSSMGYVIGSLASIIQNMSQVFGNLNERECLSESPAQKIAGQSDKFAGWFKNVIGFMKLGILDPINNLIPNDEEIASAKSKLRTISSSMAQMPEILEELGGSVGIFSKGTLWRMITGFKINKLSKNFMYMAKIINEGIIKPIKETLPSSDELSEVNKQLNEFISILEKVSTTMGSAGKSLSGLGPMDLSSAASVAAKAGASASKKQEPAQAAAAAGAGTKGGSKKPIKIVVEESLEFGDAEDIALTRESASLEAKAQLAKALGVKDGTLSGIKVNTEVDQVKKVVRAIAEGVPQFAEGGVVNKATLGVVGEAGPEAIVPLSGIEKYSSGIIAGLDKINSTLSKLLSQTTRAGRVKNQAVSGLSEGAIEIGTDSLTVGLGVAMSPALSKMITSFKRSIEQLAYNVTNSISKIKVFIEEGSSSAFDSMSAVGEYASTYYNEILSYGQTAFDYVKDKIPASFKAYASSTFAGIKSYANQAFSSVSGYLSTAFAPMIKGFTRSMDAGEGIFSSLSRGIKAQYMSITKGKPITEVASNAFNQLKDNAIKAFDYVKDKIPQSVKDYASKAFSYIKENAGKAFSYISSKIPQPVKDYASKAFSKVSEMGGPAWEKIKSYGSQAFLGMKGYFSSAFAPMIKGFTRSMNAGEGIFKSLSRGISSQYMSITKGKPITEIAKNAFNKVKKSAGKAFTSMKDYFSSSFAPLTKGFTRSMNAGEGIFKSLSRGISSQYMSITKGKPISEIAGNAFNQVKDNAGKAFGYVKDMIPQSVKDYASKAFSKISDMAGPVWEKLKTFGSQAFGKLSSSFSSLTKGKSISEMASSAFSRIKEYGKEGFSKLSSLLGGGMKKAKEGISSAGGTLKGMITGKKGAEGSPASALPAGGMSPVENVKKVGDAGSSVKGNFETVKEAMKNLAEGLKSFANKESFLGALNLIPTAIGLTAMIPGFLGAKLVEKINGKKVGESFNGLSTGLKSMASGKVLMGAGALLLSSIAMIGLIPALPALAILGAMSKLITSGLSALGTGLGSFGMAVANPMFWLGIAGIAALGAALIPFGYALSTLSPLITSFGNAVGTVLGGISGIITAVAEGMTNFLGQVSLEKAAGLMGIAGGLFTLSAAMVVFATATAASGWISFFGGNSKTLNNILRLADAGPNLSMFAQALDQINGGLSGFEESLGNVGSIESDVERLINVAMKLSAVAPMIDMATNLMQSASASKATEVPGAPASSSGEYKALKTAYASSEGVGGAGPKTGTAMAKQSINRAVSSTDPEMKLKDLGEKLYGQSGPSPETKLKDLGEKLYGQSGSASVSTASASKADKANVQQKLMKEKASLSPSKSEVVSPELGALTTETEEQTEILNEMKHLFEQFLEMLKPKSSPSSSGGGEPGSTKPQTVVGKPINLYRRVSGNITQTPGQATLNLGPKAVS